jgi:AcrR family transcriptional regulator
MEAAMKTDRRVDKTHKALRRAISELIEEKPYEDITVTELVERANIARSSFYAHFKDKDDLLLSGFQDIGVSSADDIFIESEEDAGYPNFAIVLFRGAEEWKSMAKAFLNLDSATVASHHMRNMLVIQTRNWLKKHTVSSLPEKEVEAIVHYLTSALIGLLTWWVRNDFPFSADFMSEKFNQLAVTGLQGLGSLDI